MRTLRANEPCFKVFRFLGRSPVCVVQRACVLALSWVRSARKIHLVVVPHASSHKAVPVTTRHHHVNISDTPHTCQERAHLAPAVMWSTFAKYRKGDSLNMICKSLIGDVLLKGPLRRRIPRIMPSCPPSLVTWAPVTPGLTRSGLTPRVRGRLGAWAGGCEAATSSPTRMSRSGARCRPLWSLTTLTSTGGPGARWVRAISF